MRILALTLLATALAAQGPGGPGGQPPAPLPPQPVPTQNPITPAKAMLGKLLFWEEQMSTNNRVACGTCHTFGAGGGDLRRARQPGPDGVVPSPDDIFASPGVIRSDANNEYLPDPTFGFNTQITGRATPSFLLAAWFDELFWDGRAPGAFVDPDTGVTVIPVGGALENQALGPLLSSAEMAHDVHDFAQLTGKLVTARPLALATNLPADMAAAVAGNTSYPDLFATAFGTPDITAQRIAYAVATYQRTLVPNQTPYDAFVAGNTAALTPNQQAGLGAFMGPGRCNVCHTSGLFSDGQFHNLGLRPIVEDNGRQSVTNNPADAGRFKTPSLRNVGLRNTFMHNGRLTSLGQVVGFYANGGGPNLQNKSPILANVFIPPFAVNPLIDFLANGLTDPRVAQGVAPFDRPTLRSQLLGPRGAQYGIASPGTGGRVPRTLAEVPANIGNTDFKLGVHSARGGAPVTLVFAVAPASTTLAGVNVNVALSGGEVLVSGVLNGAPGAAGAGYGTFRVHVPNLPSLSGLTLFSQWFVWDVGAPNGVAATRGAEVRLF